MSDKNMEFHFGPSPVYFCDRCGKACLSPKLYITGYICKECYSEAMEQYIKFIYEKKGDDEPRS